MNPPPQEPSPILDIYNYVEACVKSNILFISAAIYLIILMYFIRKDPDQLFESQYFYTVIIVFPVLMCMIYYMKKSNMSIALSNLTLGQYAQYGGLLIAFVGILYLYNNVTVPDNIIRLMTGSFAVITFAAVIVGLSILYKIFFNYIYKLEGMNGFIVNLIFYIPCMLLNTLEYLNKDFKQAPFAVYVLLMVEVVLLLVYLYLPKIISFISNSLVVKDGKPILEDPMIISRKENLTSYIKLNDAKPDDLVNNKFAISMWVYVVPIPPTTYPYNSDATIFEYGSYHPRLIYNGATNKFKSFVNQSTSYEFDMPLQTWNHVVYNYTKSSVDLFVNGELVSTVNQRNTGLENLNRDDIVCIGQENGLTGGLCNVVYFKKPLFQYEVKNLYELFKGRDPPI